MLTLGPDPGPGDLGSDARRYCYIFSDTRRRDDFWKDMLGKLWKLDRTINMCAKLRTWSWQNYH